MERRLIAVEAGSNRMVTTLDAAWGALQALTSQEEQEQEPSVEEDVGNEEEEAEEMSRDKGAESGNPEGQEGSRNGSDVVMG